MTPRRLTLAASPHWPSLVRGGQAGGRGRRLDRRREGVATYRDGLTGHGPTGSRPALRSPGSRQDRPLSRGGPPARDRGPGRSAELVVDRLSGFANLSPCRTAS
jgi:hypothetical protein